ncbi:DMATS family aromatic prenyltransferase [Streptomyces sodiiphilus]|uniref:DMATS family aromatic prenyltransferase n=1 Tax=Streptomyces sodiiphilus TaxID=226217 RepID=A0ABP5AY21_9ACTN
MTTSPPRLRETTKAEPLGSFVAGQLTRLCRAVGLGHADAHGYADLLTQSLEHVVERPLDLPPHAPTFLSDDHTPVEFSLSFVPGADPTLRVLLEPGHGAGDLAANGRTGLRVVRAMAQRWGFTTDRLDELEDLFFPPSPQGPLALWLALELRPGGVPKVKVYLNPAASGKDRAARTVREALCRLGHERAFATLPQADGYPFLALDLGDWETPRAKIYLAHQGLSVADSGALSRMDPGPEPHVLQEFLCTAGDLDASPAFRDSARFAGRPVLSCHSFTEAKSGLPSGFTLHFPVRDYASHDGEARARARALLSRYGMDPAPLDRALAGVSGRRLQDGVGLIAYLALVHELGRPPRVTTYISSEAYKVQPPRSQLSIPLPTR